MADKWRLFIALELPQNIIEPLTELQMRLIKACPERAVRWTRPDGTHLTLKFLGDTDSSKRDTLESALTRAAEGHTPFKLTVGRLGCFPNMRRPRVIWIGAHKDIDALRALRDSVETYFAPLGYPTEDRPFNPHLTLGRLSRESRPSEAERVGDLIARASTDELGTWTVERVALIRSELKSIGPVYTPLYHADLR